VTVNRDALLARPPGWLADWGVRAEARGCIAPGFGHALALRIIESVPLNPTAAYRLLHASSSVTGFVDLGPENRLEVFSPILREERRSAALDWTIDKISGQGYQLNVDLKPDFTVIGFERAWYAVRRKRGHLGYVIMPLSATRNIQGTVQEMPHPETNYFLFQEEPAFFRLFLKRDANGVVAIVTFAPTPEELDRRTAIVANDSGACERMQEICRTLPRSLGVNPYTAAIVNGREVNVPIGGTVSTAIQAAGVKNSSVLLPRLKVSRFFGNKLVPIIFDHNSEDILNIPLTGRERISW
jgi:hypothetical protein